MAVQEIRNPIIPGFAPDPSCIQVDGWYYLVNSSFYAFPGLPIYASKNLQNWSHIGNAINRVEQLSLEHAVTDSFPMGPGRTLIACQGLLAPSIRHHKGTFFVICTNTSSDGDNLTYENFYVMTTDIWSNEWSDPIHFDFCGIDSSLFFDDDDRTYIQFSYRAGPVWDPQCTVGQFEVDITTGKALSNVEHIWDGALGKQDVEGPHMYKKDGCYYLLTAEDGTFERHAITMARSDTIWGPFQSCPSNPILCAYGSDETIQHTGHGDLFQSPDGQWWCVCLGVRKVNGRCPLSRETFLTPVEWPTNSWPIIAPPQLRLLINSGYRSRSPSPHLTTSAGLEDVFIRTPDLQKYHVDESTIWIKPSVNKLSSISGSPSFLGQRQRSITSAISVRLDLSAIAQHLDLRAGLSIYKDERRHACLTIDPRTSRLVVEVTSHNRALRVAAERFIAMAGSLELRVQATNESYTFSYIDGFGGEWRMLGVIDTDELAAYDFTGPLFGVFTYVEREGAGYPEVSFSDLSIT